MTLDLHLGKAVTRPRNCYIVSVDLMHGDADASSVAEYGPFDAVTLLCGSLSLEQVLRVVEAVNSHNDNDTYADVPDWELIEDEWDNDSTTDHQFPAHYTGHRVRYFNDAGQEFEVTYTLGDAA